VKKSDCFSNAEFQSFESTFNPSPIIFFEVSSKALRLTEFSELFVFASFGNVRLSKFGNFSEKNGIFELAKFSRKSSEKSLDINQNCTSISKISKKLRKV